MSTNTITLNESLSLDLTDLITQLQSIGGESEKASDKIEAISTSLESVGSVLSEGTLLEPFKYLDDSIQNAMTTMGQGILQVQQYISFITSMTTAIEGIGGIFALITSEAGGLGAAMTALLGPVGLVVAGITLLSVTVLAVINHHKKQEEEVKKVQMAYEKLQNTMKNGNIKDLKQYDEALSSHQKMLYELTDRVKKYKDAHDTIGYNAATRDLEDYIKQVEKEGVTVDVNTGKIKELSIVKSKLNSSEELVKIKENISNKVEENIKTIGLIDKYKELYNTKNRTKAQDIELSNISKELNKGCDEFTLSLDKNGNAVIANTNLLNIKKEALDIELQKIKEVAYVQAASAIDRELVEVNHTTLTVSEVSKRIKAYQDEMATMDENGAYVQSRATSGMREMAKLYVDAEERKKKAKDEIDKIQIPSASGYDNNKGANRSEAEKTYKTGIEATSKYAKNIQKINEDLNETDKNMGKIQNRINESKAINTTEELSRVIKEETNLYHAQDEKIKVLNTSLQTLNKDKNSILSSFKGNWSSLKDVDISKWTEVDFNSYFENVYKQIETKDQNLANKRDAGLKLSQSLVADLVNVNKTIADAENNIATTKEAQIATLKDYWNSILEADKLKLQGSKLEISATEEQIRMNNSLKGSENEKETLIMRENSQLEQYNVNLKENIDRYTSYRDSVEKGSVAWNFWNEQVNDATKELNDNTIAIYGNSEGVKNNLVDNANHMADKIKDALKESYKEAEEAQEESINKELDNLDKWKEHSLRNINDVYDEKNKSIERSTNAQIRALQEELNVLDSLDTKHNIEMKDKEDFQKEAELRKLLSMNWGSKKKEELQKELDKLLKDREERKYNESLEAQKEAIKRQMDQLKYNADLEKQRLQDEKEKEIRKIENSYDTQRETLNNDLELAKKHYKNLEKEATINANVQKLIVENNQKDIVKLLQDYGKDYEIAGASLGDRLVNSFKNKALGINDVISNITDSVKDSFMGTMNQSKSAFRSINLSSPSLSTLDGANGYEGSSITNNSTKFGSLLHTDKIILNNNMSIEQLAGELFTYFNMHKKAKGGYV